VAKMVEYQLCQHKAWVQNQSYTHTHTHTHTQSLSQTQRGRWLLVTPLLQLHLISASEWTLGVGRTEPLNHISLASFPVAVRPVRCSWYMIQNDSYRQPLNQTSWVEVLSGLLTVYP
jgi:hypothetical protein